ncbi:cytosine deaminase [Salinarimonas rosea]|uniref:cytosine deaminase n=1 Tax=Salinarimonas rosea TaxID=552063 RepID=UPI0004082FF2|nr:cytosine deaminase [Salinarimonas rosea]
MTDPFATRPSPPAALPREVAEAPAWRIANARAPLCLLRASGVAGDAEGLARVDLVVEDGRITGIGPAGGFRPDGDDLPRLDLAGRILLPRLVDVHTHIDKGHIWPRRPNPDGSFAGALAAVAADREAHWSADDVARRMDFSLRCALAHGTGALRTHIDSSGRQTATSWPVFAEMRETWRGIVALQGVSLFPLDMIHDDPHQFHEIVSTTARYEGVLGAVTFLGAAPDARVDAALDILTRTAAAEGLDLDLHVDESLAPEARTLERIADAAIRNRFPGRILAGHCCALAAMEEGEAARVIDKVAQARIAVVSLPMCNMYLQDRAAGRTPRRRGVAPLHELAAAGVPVMVASDNTRDPFYAYGDLDLIEVFREATRILQLDHSGRDWLRTIAATPADVMGLDGAGRLEAGGPADFVLLRARSLDELLSRPQSDRIVIAAGRPLASGPPDYSELDDLMHR